MNVIEKKMTTKEVAESLSRTVKTVLENAKKCLPNKVFENGKPTEWSEAEVTVLLDYMKEHSNVGAGIDLVNDLQAVSTSMTPATETSPDTNEFQYSKEDICNMCNVSARTFDNFIALQPMAKRDFISTGSSHKKFYNENVLKQFQLWLMNNQVNQGVQVEIVKNNIESNIKIGLTLQEIVNSGNIEAMKELTTLAMNACAEVARNKQLESENKLLLEQKQAAIEETNRIYQVEHNFHNKSYSASQIAAELGVTPKKIGALANQHRLKIDPIYGKLCKIQLQNGKWVDQFMYNEEAKEVLANLTAEEV